MARNKMLISPYSSTDIVRRRLYHNKKMHCPRCGGLCDFDLGIPGIPEAITVRCDDCGRTACVPIGDPDGGRVYRIMETGERFDPLSFRKELYSELESTEDHGQRAILLARIASDGRSLGISTCGEEWYDAVDEFALSGMDDEISKEFFPLAMDFLFDSRDLINTANIELAVLVAEEDRTPSCAEECVVWLWHIHTYLDDHDDYTDPYEELSLRRKAENAYSRMDCSGVPYIRVLDYLYKADSYSIMELYGMIDAEETEILTDIMYRKGRDLLYDDLRKGIPLNDHVFDMLFHLTDLLLLSGGPQTYTSSLRENAELFGRYKDIVLCRCTYYDLMKELNEDTVSDMFLYHDLINTPEEKHIDIAADALRTLENIPEFEFSGATMIELYILLGFIIREKDPIKVAKIYAEIMDDNGIGRRDLKKLTDALCEGISEVSAGKKKRKGRR